MQKVYLKTIGIAITLVMLGITAYMIREQKQAVQTSFAQLVLKDGNIIKPWYDKTDATFYFFLPSYVEESEVRLLSKSGDTLDFEGITIASGDSIGKLAIGKTYNVSEENKAVVYRVKLLKSENVATLFVSTATGSLDSVYKSKNNKEVAKVTVIDNDGKVTDLGVDSTIKGRGNSTWEDSEKKPFTVRFTDEESILGMGESTKWALLANAFDNSGIRNAIVFDLARSVGMDNVPEYRFVDLYLNGEYNGLYMLCQSYDTFYERNGLDPDNLLLFSAEDPERLLEANYAISVEKTGVFVDVYLPPKLNTNDKKMAESIIEEIDEAITGYSSDIADIIDLRSWAQKYLIDEIFDNYDAGISSSFFFKYLGTADSVVYAGPVWDYDNTLKRKNPQALYANQQYRAEDNRRLWYYELTRNPVFYKELISIFEKDFIPQIDKTINEQIDSLAQMISSAKRNDDLRWGCDSTEEYEYIKRYLSEKYEFLKNVWLNGEEYCVVTYYGDEKPKFYRWIYIHKGDSLAAYPEYVELLADSKKWYIEGTANEYDLTNPINEDITLSSKASVKESTLKVLIEDVKTEKKAFAIGVSVLSLWVLPLAIVLGKRLNKGVS